MDGWVMRGVCLFASVKKKVPLSSPHRCCFIAGLGPSAERAFQLTGAATSSLSRKKDATNNDYIYALPTIAYKMLPQSLLPIGGDFVGFYYCRAKPVDRASDHRYS